MKKNYLVMLLISVVAIVAGMGLLLAISHAVRIALTPMNGQLIYMSKNLSHMAEQIEALEKKYNDIASKQGAGQQPADEPSEDLSKVYDIPIGQSPIIGPSDAPLTVVEFTDLQCPYCARFHPPLKEALLAYSDKVRLVIKHYPLPFHPNARGAAKLALAGNEQGKYQELIELLLQNSGDTSEAKIKEYANRLGLDLKKLTNDFKNKDAQWEAMIVEDEKLVEQIEVRGTPSYYLNGRITNARDAQGWKAEFDKALAQ